MLNKLLKYDFKSVFKYWWLAAVSSAVLSILGAGCIILLKSERNLPEIVNVVSILALILSILGITIFSVLTLIFILVRFYKNFFTDEGYLTFTLPVKRSQLLNSKLITSGIFIAITLGVCLIDFMLMLGIGFAEEIFTAEFFETVSEIWNYIVDSLGFYLIIYILEVLALLALSIISSNLFIFICITFASIITKKAKVITAIGIYYAANSAVSFAIQIFWLFGIQSISKWISVLPLGSGNFIVALVMLGIIFFMAIICSLLYTLEYFMLDRKLNLN